MILQDAIEHTRIQLRDWSVIVKPRSLYRPLFWGWQGLQFSIGFRRKAFLPHKRLVVNMKTGQRVLVLDAFWLYLMFTLPGLPGWWKR